MAYSDRPWKGALAAKFFDEEVTPSSNIREVFTRLQE